MKKTKYIIPLVTLITLSQVVHALELPVVSKYSEAESAQIWLKAKTDQVPAPLMSLESVSNPTSSYSSLFPKTFLQEELFAVCYQDCDSKDIFKLKNGEIVEGDRDNWNVIEQSNVYFWLNKYFTFLETHLNYRPQKHLRVLTNREMREDGKVLKNNAFFTPTNLTLSFLPASKNLMFKLMGGKINRSGFDPSVIAHEASHYFFDHLYPNALNDEISGLNEGFADYIANIFLDNPKMGLVMLHGKSLRDASNVIASDKQLKVYAPNMEVHNLGERVAYALWETRKLAPSKEEYDRHVIEAVMDLNHHPYHAVHDFKEKMLARTETLLDSSSISQARAIWELVLAGQAIKIENTSFLTEAVPAQSVLGFKNRQILPEELAKSYRIPRIHENNFSILKQVKISETQTAILAAKETETLTTPYWIAFDKTRNNILGIYGLDGKLVKEANEVKEVETFSKQVLSSTSFTQDFGMKLTNFSQLLEGKGEFAMAYKIKSTQEAAKSQVFNGESFEGKAISIELKRKMLVAILGVPAIDKVTLYTIANKVGKLPEINGQSLVGYKIQLPDGSEVETILDKFIEQK